ncbi:conserved membrane hypothetical protein [Desulfovibrionales bacterium]
MTNASFPPVSPARSRASRPLALMHTVFTMFLAGVLVFLLFNRLAHGFKPSIVFCALFGTVLTLTVWAWQWTPKARANYLLTMVSVGLFLILADIVIFFFKGDEIYLDLASAAKKCGQAFDRRPKLDVVLDLRKKCIDAYPEFSSILNWEKLNAGHAEKIYPIGLIANKLTVLCNESGRYISYISDEHGFNNPPKVWDKSPVDLVLIGDSYVQGVCVEREENFAGRLTAQGLRVANLGISGFGPLSELAALKEYCPALMPSTVIWLWTEENDLMNLANERKIPQLMAYLQDSSHQNLISRQSQIDYVWSEYINANLPTQPSGYKLGHKWPWLNILKIAHLRFMAGLGSDTKTKRQAALYAGRNPECFQEQASLLIDILSEAKRVVASLGGRLIFMYLPCWGRYKGCDALPPGRYNHRDDVLGLVRSLGLPIIDGDPVLSSRPDPLEYFHFRIQSHYTSAGYGLLAKAIVPTLIKLPACEIQSTP